MGFAWTVGGLFFDLVGFSVLAYDLLKTQNTMSREFPLHDEIARIHYAFNADVNEIRLRSERRAEEILKAASMSKLAGRKRNEAEVIANISNSSSFAADLSVRAVSGLDDFSQALAKLEVNVASRSLFSSKFTLLGITLILSGFLMQIFGALPVERFPVIHEWLAWVFPKMYSL